MCGRMTDHHADVVVVGGGPAGIAAAVSAAESGCTTLLVDEGAAPGGQVWRRDPSNAPGRRAATWLTRLRSSGALTLARTVIVDTEPASTSAIRAAPPALLGESHGRTAIITARSAVILAVGARELFLPFPGWTLPGVIGIGGAQALLKSGWDVRGRSVVLAGSGPLLLPVAAAFVRAGAHLRMVAEQADARAVRRFARGLRRTPLRLIDALRYRMAFARAPYRFGTWPIRARGDHTLAGVLLNDGTSVREIDCDILCTAFALVPSIELPLLLGCRSANGATVVDEFQRTTAGGVYCAGEATGIAGVDAALVQGEIAGLSAVGRAIDATRLFARRARHAEFARTLSTAFALRDDLRHLAQDDTIVCRCEDVSWGSVRASGSMREAKLLTRAGMGACQGRVCGAALGYLCDWSADSVRPPLSPAFVATLSRNRQLGGEQ